MCKHCWTRRRWRLLAWVFVLGLALAATEARLPHPAAAAQLQFAVPDTSDSEFHLDNGLVGFIRAQMESPLVRFTMFVRAGSGDDRKQGAAEMLAWVMGRGPCWMGPGAFREALERLSADVRVRMGPDMTAITFEVPAENATQGLRLFSGVVREPCIDRPALEEFRAAPRPPVLSIPAAELDAPANDIAAALDLFYSRLFAGHPYTVVVTPAEIAALTVDDVERFYRDYFTPTNMVMAVSGLFVPPLFLRDVDQRFGDWEGRPPPRLQRAPDVELPLREVYRYPTGQPERWIVAGHELPPVRRDDVAAFDVANFILGGGHSGNRLIQEAGLRRGLTDDARSVAAPNVRGPGTYTIRTYGDAQVVDDIVEVIEGQMERMRIETISAAELDAAKQALLGSFVARFGDGHRIAATFAEELATGRGLEALVRYPQSLNDVSAEDVRRAAERYLRPDRLVVVVVGG